MQKELTTKPVKGTCEHCEKDGDVYLIVTDDGFSTYLCKDCGETYMNDEA